MGIVKFKKKVKEVEIDGKTMFSPYILLDGSNFFFSFQGDIVMFDTKGEAEEYNEL